ncbi:hypothetical protein LMG7974_00215 [Campylobacter majalis]|uniref:Uncharacterized protein n=1 Tax=Campylobacter majalis TaxID=2790656 RepID=A0ABM8Q346_9BACT|nr:hypothetical protein [Campylobacter majalis]CAD7287279.1 hypothetical protein LMG7974_00215 [Campylobacter majalis]
MRVLLILFLFFIGVFAQKYDKSILTYHRVLSYPNAAYKSFTPNILNDEYYLYVSSDRKKYCKYEIVPFGYGPFRTSKCSPGFTHNNDNKYEGGNFYFSACSVDYVATCRGTESTHFFDCGYDYPPESATFELEFSIASMYKSRGCTLCKLDEEFDFNNKRCVKCPSGQKFDQASGKCYNDCTDTNNNKYGFTDGSCWDCSNKKTNDEIKKCYCQRAGSDYTPSKHLTYFDDGTVCPDCSVEISAGDGTGRFMARCDNDLEFPYKPVGTLPVTPNKEKDPSNPEKGETSTLPSTPIVPDNDTNKSKPGDGIQPTPGDGVLRPIVTGWGSITEPNPNYKPDNQDESDKNSNNSDDNKDGKDDKSDKDGKDSPSGKDGGSPDAKGNIITNITHNHYYGDEAKQSDSEYSDKGYDFSEYEKAIDDFEKKYTDELEDYASELLKFVDKVQDTIKDYKTKSFKHLNSPSKKTSCPISSKVPIGSKVIDFSIDFCEIFHRFYTAFYSLFYFLFFVLFLRFSIKIFVLSFPQR